MPTYTADEAVLQPTVNSYTLSGYRHLLGIGLRPKQRVSRGSSLGLLGNYVPLWAEKAKIDALDGAEDLGVVGPVEGRVAAQKDVHDDPDGPQVARLVVLLLQHWRGDAAQVAECH